MSPRKLSEGDRTELLYLYRNTDETSSTLAERYGISSSTVSRFIKMNLSEEEYCALVQSKRLGSRSNSKQKEAELDTQTVENIENTESTTPEEITPIQPQEIISTEQKEIVANQQEEITLSEENQDIVPDIPDVETIPIPETPSPEPKQKPILKTKEIIIPEPSPEDEEDEEENGQALESVNTLKEMFGEEIVDEEDDDFDEEDDEEEEINTKPQINIQELSVLPLSQAKFNRNCYLAIDRTTELMTRPLKDFADLGKIPPEEINQKTLPIFDNHRMAKRFCDRRGKVIKLPDTKVLEKTAHCLKSKGITRILMNGKVFHISDYN